MGSSSESDTRFSSFAYYPSDYSITPAIPLHYRDGNDTDTAATGRSVPLIDLFPLFAASPLVNKSTPVPIVESCVLGDRDTSSPSDSASAFSLCVMDKCDKELAQVSPASYDVLLAEADRIRGGGVSARERADLVNHFNSYNVLEECAIRNCPIDYFIAHSSLCISRNHPFFLQRNMSLPATPKLRSMPSSSGISASDPSGIIASDRSGVRLPTLPLGFPCDPLLTDQSLGTILLPPASLLHRLRNYRMSSAGTWATSSSDQPYLHLSAKAPSGSDDGVHPWIAKSTLFRGFEALGTTNVQDLRTPFAALPGNLYSLGHCPQKTRRWTASKLTGETCASSIECVFSLCVEGKCAEAAGGKELDAERALVMVAIDPRYRSEDLERKAQAAMWMWIVLGSVGGLILLRVMQLWVRKWQARTGMQARPIELDEAPVVVVDRVSVSA